MTFGVRSFIRSLNEFCKFIKEVIIVHTALYLILGIFAFNALAAVGLTKDAHLEAFAILLLAVRLFTSASVDVPGVNVGNLGTLHLTLSTLHFQVLVLIWWRLAFRESFGSQALLLSEETMRSSVLDFGLESLWIPVPNVPSRRPNLLSISFNISTIFTQTLLVAVSTERKAFTVHFEAL